MNVAPGATYEAVHDWGSTGATLGMRVIDNAGATTVARLASNISEYPAGSGIYARPGNVAPTVAGQYTIVWDDDGGTAAPGHVSTEDLLVTGGSPAVGGTSNLYVTRAALKATLNIASTYADADIDVAVAAASRAIDGYKDDRYYPTSETRYYTVARYGECSITIDSLNTLTSVTIDADGDGTYETTWVDGTDFVLSPANAATDGFPYRSLDLLSQGGRSFPTYTNSVKIIGSFGWANCPAVVAQAAGILAGRFLKRARETPYGILVVTGDAVAAARLGKIDPDVAFMLDNLRGTIPLMAV